MDVVAGATTTGRWLGWLRLFRGASPEMVERVRQVLWALNLALFLSLVPPALLAGNGNALLRLAAAATLVGAIAWERVALRDGRFPLWADLLETAGIVVLAWRFPAQTSRPLLLLVLAFAFAGLGFRSLYGFPWHAAVRAATMVGAVYAGRLISVPDPRAAARLVLPVVLPAAFVATLGQILTGMLRQQDAISRRQRIAAQLNADLVAARHRDDVYDAIVRAVLALFEGRSDVRVVFWDEDSSAQPAAAAGHLASEAVGPGLLSSSLPAWISEAIALGEPVYREAVDVEEVRRVVGFKPLPGSTFLVPLRNHEVRRMLTIGAEGPMPEAVRREVESFAKVVQIAYESIELTEQLRRREEALRQRSYYDPLTRLPNRDLLRARLDWALSRSERSVALLLLDLDQFKTINDSLGHLAGDETLVAVAERLAAGVRPGDMVARLGGDEFAVFLSGVDGAGEAERVAMRVLELLEAPLAGIVGQATELFVRASIGVALSGQAARIPEDLLRNAEVAMYAAKAAGGAVYRIFEPGMRASVLERLELESDLNRALERGELSLYYQPILEFAAGSVVGVEALVRWRHPRRGMISPSRFIPLAEESGLISEIGAWVLREGCEQVKAWSTAIPGQEGLGLGVNLSPRQLGDPNLVATVSAVLADSGLEPQRLTLELTESALVEHTETNLTRLEALKKLGLRLAMDDFGTGFSSLGYLRRFPFDTLKIDREFVHGVETDPDAAALARAIIKMGKALGLECLAEGVETKAQFDWLRGTGCPLAQGNFFAPAMPPDRLGPLLAGATPWLSRRA